MTTTSKRVLVTALGWLLVLLGIGVMLLGYYHGAVVPAAGFASITKHEREGTWLCLSGAAASLLSAFITYEIDKRLRPAPGWRASIRDIISFLGVATVSITILLLVLFGLLVHHLDERMALPAGIAGLFILLLLCGIWLAVWLDRYLRAPVRVAWKLGDSDKWVK